MRPNQNPEQAARHRVDQLLTGSDWVVQSKKALDFNACPDIAIREYQTDIGPADYVLFVDKQAVGVIEAKKEEVGHSLTTVEDQTAGCGLFSVGHRAPVVEVTRASFLRGQATSFATATSAAVVPSVA